MKKFSTRVLVLLGLLVSLEIILSRFLSFSAWNVKIGFNFLPLAAAGILFGPAAGAAVGGLADLLGAILFPIGPYFPGFTLTHALTGAVYGWFLHKDQTPLRILSVVAVEQLGLGLLINTLWISILYGSEFGPLLGTRLFQAAVLCPVHFVVLAALSKQTAIYGKRALVWI